MGRAEGLAALARRAGPLLLLPALFVLAYAVASRIADRAATGLVDEPSEAASFAAPDEVGGFHGTLAVPEGVLRVRLVPLQNAAEWQRFDAVAIARRLALPAGEPWRLELAFDGEPHARPLALGRATVADAAGGALGPIPGPDGEGGTADAPVDPLRTLLARSVDALPPGAAVDLVLWGRAPEEDARVAFAGRPDRTVRLAPARVPTDELARSIARAEADEEARR